MANFHVITDAKTGEVSFEPLTPEEEAAQLAWEAGELDRTKLTVRTIIVSKRDETITSGFPYMGKTIDSDRDSVMAITGAGVAALAAKSAGLPYSVTWTCADDSTIVLDADGVLGMVVTLALFADQQHAKARPLKEAISNASTITDVKKIKWI